MKVPGYRDEPTPGWDPAAAVDMDQAVEFLQLCYRENPSWGSVEDRVKHVRAQIAVQGTYAHTGKELTYGAKVAWRNASRCIGRLYWRSLLVLDRRKACTAADIYAQLVRHLEVAGHGLATSSGGEITGEAARSATRGKGIRPVISVFAAAVPGEPYARVWNEQLIRYAGYQEPEKSATKTNTRAGNADGGGVVTGDPGQIEFTAAVTRLGWQGKRGPFDVLPLAIEVPGQPVRLFELPEHVVQEVPLSHPDYPWFVELGLRWHAIPVIANQRLSIGGVNYPLAPFNGWYMGTEIGARNLADDQRYNMLPLIASRMGLDMTSSVTLWRDRALVELNVAVLHSFIQAGVKITDHHTESARFIEHLREEGKAGRQVPADWSWIVPPLSGSTTPVFHRYYYEAHQQPGFYLDDPDSITLAAIETHAELADVPSDCPPATARRAVQIPRQTTHADTGDTSPGCPAHANQCGPLII